jgi:hypothetical protein
VNAKIDLRHSRRLLPLVEENFISGKMVLIDEN